MTLTEIRTHAAELKIAGRSKMNKAELIVAIGDACYDEAVSMDRAYSNAVRVTKPRTGKSYTERMLNRLCGYHAQNGSTRLTPAQERRYNKKYRKQYGNLPKSLTAS